MKKVGKAAVRRAALGAAKNLLQLDWPSETDTLKINLSRDQEGYNPSILQSAQAHRVDIIPGNGLCRPGKNNVSAEAKRMKRTCAYFTVLK